MHEVAQYDAPQVPTLAEIIASWGTGSPLIEKVENAFCEYTGILYLREAFYRGVECRNWCASTPNPYSMDQPEYRAFLAGFSWGVKCWGERTTDGQYN